MDEHLEAAKNVGQRCLESFRNLLDIQQRDISHPAFNSAVIRPVQPASLCGFFLIDLLFLADATDSATKPDANIYWHWV
jgi:hypothetical protein